jgi:hypothetical protein
LWRDSGGVLCGGNGVGMVTKRRKRRRQENERARVLRVSTKNVGQHTPRVRESLRLYQRRRSAKFTGDILLHEFTLW